MANSKENTNKSKSLKNKSRESIEKIKNFLSLDLSNLAKKNSKIIKEDGDVDSIERTKNTEKPENFKRTNYQSANLSKSKDKRADDANIPQTLLSKHRLEQNKKNMQTDAFISHVQPNIFPCKKPKLSFIKIKKRTLSKTHHSIKKGWKELVLSIL